MSLSDKNTRHIYDAALYMGIAAGLLLAGDRIAASHKQVQEAIYDLAEDFVRGFGEIETQQTAFFMGAYEYGMEHLPRKLPEGNGATAIVEDKRITVYHGFYELHNSFGKVEESGICPRGMLPDEVYQLLNNEQLVVLLSGNEQIPSNCTECSDGDCNLGTLASDPTRYKVACTKKRPKECPLRLAPAVSLKEVKR